MVMIMIRYDDSADDDSCGYDGGAVLLQFSLASIEKFHFRCGS
jgi:hypothetical protein